MKYIFRILAVIILITYALNLVNAQSDLLVFTGLAIIGAAIYMLFAGFDLVINLFKSKIS